MPHAGAFGVAVASCLSRDVPRARTLSHARNAVVGHATSATSGLFAPASADRL